MQTYDFIIVGSGSAGSVLADKLSASGRFSVLVLEAGGTDRRFYVQMPLGYGKTFFDPAVNWNYKPEPDPGLGGNVDHWPRGKLLGGSSSINAMVWIRGAREDFDDWRAAGNPGWGYDDLLPAFKALEDNQAGADTWRGTGGPLHISDCTNTVHPLTRRYLAAGQQAGLPLNPDFNGATQEGVGVYQISTRNGRRMSAARAFLRPAMKRGNVHVETNALATRILFEGKRAVGIEYLRNGQSRTARAGRELIISAGSINSPQLLQLSGIGPSALLRNLGIPVIHANENVGANLQDHVGINYTFKGKVPTLNQILRPWWGKLLVGMQYILTRSGPLSLSMNHGGGFLRTDPAFSRPNMQLYFQAFSTVIPKSGERPILTPDPWPGFSIGLSNCRPSSRGEIMIRSSNPLDYPKIVANAYSTNADVAEMLDAVKFVRRIASMPAMAEIIAEEVLPGPSIQSDADLITDFRKRSGTVYHPVSTCRMGPDPARAVVDPRLKVHGIEGLRVIDASIFPDNITGNTNAASVMTGWKGAELVLEDQKMKITDVKTWVVGNPPPGIGGKYFIFVKLTTDGGVVGYGEAYNATFSAHVTAKLVEDMAERYLIGHDPHDIETFFRRAYSSGFTQRPDVTGMGCFSALEMACWDIVGKEANKPVYKLLGGQVHETLRSYTYLYPHTGSVHSEDARGKNVYNDPDLAAACALEYVEQGFNAVKLDPAGPYTAFDGHQPRLADIDLSARMVKAIREAVGTRADILFGTHGQFTASGALRMARAIEPYDPLWFEEPVPPDMPEVMAQVARGTSIPIATGERLTTKFEFARVIENRAATILQPDLSRSGGILETKKIAAMAEAYHIQIAPHCYCGPIVGAANVQLAATLPNFLILESLKQWDGFHATLLKKKIEWQDGNVIPSKEPGLGVELNEAVCEAHPYTGKDLHLQMMQTPLMP